MKTLLTITLLLLGNVFYGGVLDPDQAKKTSHYLGFMIDPTDGRKTEFYVYCENDVTWEVIRDDGTKIPGAANLTRLRAAKAGLNIEIPPVQTAPEKTCIGTQTEPKVVPLADIFVAISVAASIYCAYKYSVDKDFQDAINVAAKVFLTLLMRDMHDSTTFIKNETVSGLDFVLRHIKELKSFISSVA